MSMGDHKYCNCCCHQVYMPIGRPTQTNFLEAHIDTLKSQLSSALSREKALREALEEIAQVCLDGELDRHQKLDAIWSIARQALEGQPEVKEVNIDQLAYAIECYMGGELFIHHDLASHLLSRFIIEDRRKE